MLVLSLFLVSGAAVTTPFGNKCPGDEARPFDDSPPGLLDNRTFWRISSGPPVSVPAGLVGTSGNAYWYLEDELARAGLNYTSETMNETMNTFESWILPRLHAAFGFEPLPPNDVDGDPRSTILVTAYESYFDYRNEEPATQEPISNEREMIYVRYESDPAVLLNVIAHEFTHLIQWNYDPLEAAWVTEGLAQVAQRVVGYDTTTPPFYLENTTVGLMSGVFHYLASYGAWELFVQYQADHYGGWNFTRALTQNPLVGTAGVESTLNELGYPIEFRSLFRDWMVANLVNNETSDGARWRYANFTGRATPTVRINRLPWTGRFPTENGGIWYMEIAANETHGTIRIDVSGAGPDSLLAMFIVQAGDTVLVIDAEAAGPANVTASVDSVPVGARLTLAVAYLNETGYSEVDLVILADRVPQVLRPDLPLVYLVSTGLLLAAATVLVVVAYRKRKGGSRRNDEAPET